ncbi:MAG: hypothetical protein ACYSSK_01485, partial [Planctomycetota bacterium]
NRSDLEAAEQNIIEELETRQALQTKFDKEQAHLKEITGQRDELEYQIELVTDALQQVREEQTQLTAQYDEQSQELKAAQQRNEDLSVRLKDHQHRLGVPPTGTTSAN